MMLSFPLRGGLLAAGVLLLPLLIVACDSPLERIHSGGLEARMRGEQGPASATLFREALAPHLAGLDRLPTQGPSGRAVEVVTRTPQISRYPCSGCHTESVDTLKDRIAPGGPRTHAAIVQPHSPGSTLTCAGCHDLDAGMDGLRLSTGRRISFDESFQVCAQCHFQQARDWEGGAHGKRIAGWAGPRIVQSCAACHNPHDPLQPVVTPRWPAVVPNAPARAPHTAE